MLPWPDTLLLSCVSLQPLSLSLLSPSAADDVNYSLVVSANTKISYLICNAIAIVKVITLLFIAITGLVVLGGHTNVVDPGANFQNSFEKLEGGTTAYGITNALYKIVFAYAGYTNAFNVVNEVKVSSPVIATSASGFTFQGSKVWISDQVILTSPFKNPIKQIRRNGFISLAIVTILYILANVAFFASGKSHMPLDTLP